MMITEADPASHGGVEVRFCHEAIQGTGWWRDAHAMKDHEGEQRGMYSSKVDRPASHPPAPRHFPL